MNYYAMHMLSKNFTSFTILIFFNGKALLEFRLFMGLLIKLASSNVVIT